MKNRPLCSVCLFAFLLISICVFAGGAKFIKELRPSAFEQKVQNDANVRVTGQVYDQEIKDDYQILYLKNNSITYQNKSFIESRIILYNKEKINIQIGNRVEASGNVSFYEEERNPGNFNQKLYYQKQKIHAQVWTAELRIIDFTVDRFQNSLYEFRCRWKNVLFRELGKEDGAILTAILLGDKTGMNEKTKELYQANGIGHILAISGLHLSIIGLGLYKVMRRLSGSYLIGGLAGIGFLILYVLMIGMSVSALRALIMFLFHVGADMTGRHYDSLTAVAVSALISVVWKPLYLYDGGFWLSYGAILAIILVLPVFEELIFQGFWASVSISLVTLPVLLFYFYEIPLYSIVLNLFVIPLMTVVLVCGLLGSILCMQTVAANIGQLLMWGCGRIFDLYEVCCRLFLKFPAARIVAGQPKVWQILVYYTCLFLLVVMWRKKRRWRVESLLVLFSVLVMLGEIRCPESLWNNPAGNVMITVLDVGQGDCIIVKGPGGKTYLVDGGSSDVKNVGQYRMESFLKSQGVGKLDYVFISHGDMDHINGIEEMISRSDIGVSIETIILPEKGLWDDNLLRLAKNAMNKGVRVGTIEPGQKLVQGGFSFTCLAPEEKDCDFGSGNAASMVLALKYRDFDMLFTGDVEGKGEEFLTEKLKKEYCDVNWDVLKVAHHGSKNSSAYEFVSVVEPEYALISAGRDNSYGHPHEETVKRLSEVKSVILSTQENGAITIVTNGKKMKVEGYVKEK